MFYQHLLYLKSVHCFLPPTRNPLVYGLYACENVDNCENFLSLCPNQLFEGNEIQLKQKMPSIMCTYVQSGMHAHILKNSYRAS